MSLSRRLLPRRTPGRRAARHATLLALALVAAVLVLAGCDSHDDDRRNPGDGPGGDPGGVPDAGVRVATFTLGDIDGRTERFGLTYSADSSEVQYDTDDTFYPAVAGLLTPSVFNNGFVLLYVSDVLDENGLRRDGWTALPLTLGFDIEGAADGSPDGFIDYTLTTTYTYNVNRLWVNLAASDAFTIPFLNREELDPEDRLLTNLERLRFRLVTVPGGGFARGLDYTDYQAVRQAYGLPE